MLEKVMEHLSMGLAFGLSGQNIPETLPIM